MRPVEIWIQGHKRGKRRAEVRYEVLRRLAPFTNRETAKAINRRTRRRGRPGQYSKLDIMGEPMIRDCQKSSEDTHDHASSRPRRRQRRRHIHQTATFCNQTRKIASVYHHSPDISQAERESFNKIFCWGCFGWIGNDRDRLRFSPKFRRMGLEGTSGWFRKVGRQRRWGLLIALNCQYERTYQRIDRD